MSFQSNRSLINPECKYEEQSSESEDEGRFLQWNHTQRRRSMQFKKTLKEKDTSHNPKNEKVDDDKSTDGDHLSEASSEEDIENEDVNDELIPSLFVRIVDIDCDLPPNLLGITTSLVPTFQFGLIKESKRKNFLSGNKYRMSNSIVASSGVSNQMEELRWVSVRGDMFLGVEMRLWGLFPEDLEKYVAQIESDEGASTVANDNSYDNYGGCAENRGHHRSAVKGQERQSTSSSSSSRNIKHAPSIRLCSLLIPIQTIEERYPVEKTYTLDFKVAGGTQKMRESMIKVLAGYTPEVTLKLEVQLSPSLQDLDAFEDDLLLMNLRSLKSHILRDDNDSLSLRELREHMEWDVKFNRKSIGAELAGAVADRRSNAIIANELKSGIIDFICVVGPRDIDKLKKSTQDSTKKGWLPTYLKYNVIEQFPSQTFHRKNGRNIELMDEVGWWCFPEGCQAWRGKEPPTAADMNLPSRNRNPYIDNCVTGEEYNAPNASFFSTSPIGSTQTFDECFNCTTTLTWFVLQSKSDEVGSRTIKNYGICLRFFVPATDDTKHQDSEDILWIPSVLCIMTTLPIVGVVETVLLRICQTLQNRYPGTLSLQQCFQKTIYKDLANMIVNFPAPVQGVFNCTMPFLQGDRLHVRLPPLTGLPPLAHGGSVTAVCRLLGAEGK